MATKFSTTQAPSRKWLGINVLEEAHATAKHELGLKIPGANGKEFMYVEAGGTLVAGYGLAIKYGDASTNYPYVLEPADAATEQVIAIAIVAASDGEFCWVQTKGVVANVNVATSVAAGNVLIGSASAGRFAAVANNADEVVKPFAVALEAEASNLADVYIL